MAVEIDLVRGRLELLGRDLEERLLRLERGRDHGVAHPVGRSAGERAHVVRPGIGVGRVDDDLLERHAHRLGGDLADDRPQPLPEVRGRERHDERAARRGVDQGLGRVPAEVHPGRVVDGGDAGPTQLGHR